MYMLETNGHAAYQGGQQRHGSVVSFHDIHYKVTESRWCWRKKTTKDILIDLNGVMRPGLNAIMGSTGSGKSSFLDVLAARKDPVGLSGEVLIDGAPQPEDFKCRSGYVVQDDMVMGSLTVRENIRFSAALRLPSSIPDVEKDVRVERLISELGLDKVADSRVGTQMLRGISGGEKKRTSIGMELIIDPPVLFLDEPTTGLDSNTANSVLLLLKRMANNGRTIILSIHQPRYSIFCLFDSLTLLTEGQQVYHGAADRALQYFTNMGYTCEAHNNPADFFLDVLKGFANQQDIKGNGDFDRKPIQMIEQQLLEEYQSSDDFRRTKVDLARIMSNKPSGAPSRFRRITYTNNFFIQFRWVIKRTFQNLILSPQVYIAQTLVTFILALVLGCIFFEVKLDHSGIQNRVGVLFFVIVNQCFGSLTAADAFVNGRQLFVHEYISGYYRLSVYFLCLVFSDILTLRTIPAIIYTIVAYYMIGLKATVSAFFTFMVTIAMTAYAASSMTVAISIDHTVVAVANILATIGFVFMMIFAGLLVNLPSVASWLAWLKYFSIPRYGFSALEINEFEGLNFCNGLNSSSILPLGLRRRTFPKIICKGEDFLDQQGVDYSTWGLWENHIALGVMTLTFLAIALLKLHLMKKFS